MTAQALYRLAETPGYTVEPRADNVRWLSIEPQDVLRVHKDTDHDFHWTIFFYEHIDLVSGLCFITSSDIPAEQNGYDTKELAVAAVTEYYTHRQCEKVTQ